MKKLIKRTLSLALAVLMVLTVIPVVPAHAADLTQAGFIGKTTLNATPVAATCSWNNAAQGYQFKPGRYGSFSVSEDFLKDFNGKATIELEYAHDYGTDFVFAYTDTNGNRVEPVASETKASTNANYTVNVYHLEDAGFNGTLINGNEAFAIWAGASDAYIRSVVITKVADEVEPDPSESEPVESEPAESEPAESEPVESQPTEVEYGATWQYGSAYSMLTGAFKTAEEDFIFEGDEPYDWTVTLTAAGIGANVTVEAVLENQEGGQLTGSKNVAVYADTETELLTYADFKGLGTDYFGSLKLTVTVKHGTNTAAQLVAYFARVEVSTEPETATDPGDVIWTYAEGYDWITGAFVTADEDYIFEGTDPYDWTVTVSPTSTAATIDVEATIIDLKGNIVSTATKTVEAGKAPAVTEILAASDFEGLSKYVPGTFKLSATLSVEGKAYAGVEAVFGRTQAAGTATWTYKTGNEWLTGAFNTADEDLVYVGEQPYDWTATLCPTRGSATVTVKANIVDLAGNVISSVEKTVDVTQAPSVTTLVSIADFPELTPDMLGVYQLTCQVYLGTTGLAELKAIFYRVEGEWVDTSVAPTFSPEYWESCEYPAAITVTNNDVEEMPVSVKATITKLDGTTVSLTKNYTLAVGGTETIVNGAQMMGQFSGPGTYTVTLVGYWKYNDADHQINQTITYVYKAHELETVSGKAATCTEPGLTDGVYCPVCNWWSTPQEEIPAGHTEGDVVIENEVASTWEAIGSYDEVIYCTACGEEISRVTKDALLNPFYSNAMELSSQLTLHIIIKIDTLGIDTMAAVKESGYYAVVTLINDEGEAVETTIPASEWQGHTKNRMRIPFDAWNPTQMADALKVVLYNNDGEQISVAKDTSVREIAMYEIEQYAALGGYDNYVTLLVDMLNYGTASQNNFGYNTDDYANALLSDELKAYATADVVYPARKDNSGVAFFQSTAFELLSRVEMQLVLTNTFGVDVSQVVAEVSYTTFSGKLVEQTVNGTDFKTHTKGRFKCVIDWLDIPDCQQDVTIVFKDTDGNELATVNESVMSALGYYSELLPDAELYPALIKFINSASAYFAN